MNYDEKRNWYKSSPETKEIHEQLADEFILDGFAVPRALVTMVIETQPRFTRSMMSKGFCIVHWQNFGKFQASSWRLHWKNQKKGLPKWTGSNIVDTPAPTDVDEGSLDDLFSDKY